MNTNVASNYSRLKPSLFFLPIFLLITIALFLYTQHSLHADKYIQLQKESFFSINYKLGQFPNIEYNITQLGDALILLSFLSVFIVYAPKIWQVLISASLVSLIFSNLLKNIFAVPRPAVVFDNNSFIIVGKAAVGFASLPSGHSITVFTTLTVLLFAFMPKQGYHKVLGVVFTLLVGWMIAFTRVGVGAHYPLDVIIGSIVGYISGLTGIFIDQKFKIWAWINNQKYYPVFILLLLISGVLLVNRIIIENLMIFYLALASLFFPLYKMIYVSVKK
jgi:membrane-associated phospholipid phosphatase